MRSSCGLWGTCCCGCSCRERLFQACSQAAHLLKLSSDLTDSVSGDLNHQKFNPTADSPFPGPVAVPHPIQKRTAVIQNCGTTGAISRSSCSGGQIICMQLDRTWSV